MVKNRTKRNKSSKKLYFALLIFLLVGLLFSGCQKSLQGKTTLEMVTLAEPRSFDPYLLQPVSQKRWSFLIFDGLWDIDEKGGVKESLAYLPEFLNEGKTVKVKLKKGVKWQDGQPFTAFDVEFTWRVLSGKVDPDYKPELYKPYEYIERVEAKDDETLFFYLKKPFYHFGYLFPAILPKHLLVKKQSIVNSDFWFKPIGTGPYRLSQWEIGKKMVFEANQDYFKGKPRIEKIRVSVVFSIEEAKKLISEGKVDLCQDIPEDEAKTLSKELLSVKESEKVLDNYPVGWEAIFLNTQGKWFKEDDFRTAFFYGLDWQKGREFMDKKEAGLFGIPPFKNWEKLVENYTVRLNRKKAIDALHRQGYKNIGPMKLWERKRDETFNPKLSFDARFQFFDKKRYELFIKVLRPEAEKTRIDLTVNLFTSRMFLAPKEKSGSLAMGQNFDLLYFSQEFYPHPLMRKPFLFQESPKVNDRGLNFAYYSSLEIEKNYEAAEKAKDKDELMKCLTRIYDELKEKKILIPFGYTYYYVYKPTSIANYQPPKFWETSFQNVEQWELK